MYFILRHPGFEWRAAQAAGFIAVSVATLVLLSRPHSSPALRTAVAAGALAVLAAGAAALWENHRPGAHFEGFVDVIGWALCAQGVLTFAVMASVGRARTSGV